MCAESGLSCHTLYGWRNQASFKSLAARGQHVRGMPRAIFEALIAGWRKNDVGDLVLAQQLFYSARHGHYGEVFENPPTL